MITARKRRVLSIAVAVILIGLATSAYRGGSFAEWLTAPVKVIASNFTSVVSETGADLAQLGYLAGYNAAPEETGVTYYDEKRAGPGYNFYTPADFPHAFLIDMHGKMLHHWQYEYNADWPERMPDEAVPSFEQHAHFWRRAHLLPNGDVLAIFEGMALLKVDKDSNLLWAYRGGFHHDLDVLPDGRIFVLSRRLTHHPPAIPDRETVVEDMIAELSADGQLIRRLSILDAFANSPFRQMLLERLPRGADVTHANTVEILTGSLAQRCEALRKGTVLVSLRSVDLIAVVDLDLQRVVWATAGDWKMQHQPTVLENGRMLLFDNQGGPAGFSRVIEFNPFTGETYWQFVGNAQNGFLCPYAGSCQRLPEGNTLITDSMAGRVLEVTADGQIVWAWIDSRRTGPGDNLVAAVYDMVRFDDNYLESWLKLERIGH